MAQDTEVFIHELYYNVINILKNEWKDGDVCQITKLHTEHFKLEF